MKKLVLIAVVALGLAITASEASAQAPTPFCGNGPCGPRVGPFASFFGRSPMPALQAAPWYSYWPYNSHFQTPAPLHGAYYAPGYTGGGMVNPYFPAR